MRIVLSVLWLFLAGCGYKPLAYYANEAFGKSIYVEIMICPDFPKAGVKLKDFLNQAILTRLHLSLAPKESAESVLKVEISDIRFEMIAEDSEGFANHYRSVVRANFSYQDQNQRSYQFQLEGSSDYPATSAMTSIAIDKAQLNAINSSLQQIIDQFVSRIFYQGVIQGKGAKS